MQPLLTFGAWLLLMLVCVLAYLPGLSGPFVFDDFGALPALGDRGGITDWETFRVFVFGGHSGPTGRPLSLLTFLIDANNWPAESFPFKRTNLAIHLLNGILLGVVIGQVLSLLRYGKQAIRWITLVSVACWLLHPFLVSTTLYVVQRMAQLSTLFCLAGIAVYLSGRTRLAHKKIQGYLLMSLAVGLFTCLATLSKENGALLPLLIGTVEITIVASQRDRVPSLAVPWMVAFLALPSAAVVVYLGAQVFNDGFFEVAFPRDYSLYERLLTQSRILVEYLQHWFIPKLYTTGVYQDHFIKSTGFLAPVTTALGTVLHFALIATALMMRRRRPLFALAILFFYTSHLIESTVINLELYFEHRNYLAACFLFLPLIVLLYEKTASRTFIAAGIVMISILGGFMRYSATVWESLPSMAAASARIAPTSARAQAQFATQLYNAGRPVEALDVIDRAIDAIPKSNTQLMLSRLIILCNQQMLEREDFEMQARELSDDRYDGRSLNVYSTFIQTIAAQSCPSVPVEALLPLFSNMLNVEENANPQSLEYSHIQYFIGFIESYSGNPEEARAAFEESLSSRPGASHAMLMAAHMATNGFFKDALHLSDVALTQMDADSRSPMGGSRVSEADIRAFQEVVRGDMGAAQSNGTSGPGP